MAMNLSSETRMSSTEYNLSQTPPPSPQEIAKWFPNFDILECLGRGGMGVVYKARQKTLDREVAIKVLAGEWEEDTTFAERFEREAKILAQMSHPNIVTIHDFGQTDGLYYIVMEYVDGVNLRDLLSDGKMAPEQALAIVPPICEALEYAHSKGIVHRDIKPANLLLDRDGRVKIADFGIASLVGATTDISGTPSYMAPEQAKGSVDCRADIYALGVVLYEMLTGERPTEDVVPPSKKIEVDVKIDEMVLRALEREPERRYQSAHEFQTTAEFVMSTPAGAAQEEGAPNASPAEQSAWKSPDSGWGWFIGNLFGITFISPTAYRLANLSALGFLGFLGFLGNLPIPGARALSGLYGLFGFSGLIGLAHMVELTQRKNGKTTGTQQSSDPPASKPPVYSPWESSIVLLGIIFSVAMIFPVAELPESTRYLPLFLLFTTFYIAVTSLAGLWPLPSPLFPEPSFSSRNLRRNQIHGCSSGEGERSLPPYSALFIGVTVAGALSGALAANNHLAQRGELPQTSGTSESLLGSEAFGSQQGMEPRNKQEKNKGISIDATKQSRRDQIIIEDLALHMIVAFREKDDQKLKALASDQFNDWRKSLPVFAVELRERYRLFVGDDKLDLRATESIVDGNLGVVRCTGPSELKGKCLILFFVKDASGWKSCLLRNSTEDVGLSKHLAYLVEAI